MVLNGRKHGKASSWLLTMSLVMKLFQHQRVSTTLIMNPIPMVIAMVILECRRVANMARMM